MMRAATLATLLAGAFAVPKVLEERRALQASCWSGAFTEQRCCSGDGGDSSCWGGEFTFSHCCPATGGGRGGGRGGPAIDAAMLEPAINEFGTDLITELTT